MALILIAEDEREIRLRWRDLLKAEGYEVRLARDGVEALAAFDASLPDLVLLDVNMPNMNGFRVCEEIRRRDGLVPVVFLTALDSDTNELRGLGLGADDYISKAADEQVWLARVRLRLERAAAYEERAAAASTLRLGRATLDLVRRTVTFADGLQPSRLTVTEADIVRLLLSGDGRTLSVDEILDSLRGKGFVGAPSIVRTHICNLRVKLGPEGSRITAERGSGYSLALNSQKGK